jgi:5-enolpyruvylshikimate-3-phosphate synthase
MSLAIAALQAKGTTVIENAETIDISFPHFMETIARLTQ